MTDAVTFRQLENLSNSNKTELGDSTLDDWYRRVYDIPINEFDDGDLSCACRQQIFLDRVVPIAVERLKVHPLAGEVYDGELLAAMKSIPKGYWQCDVQTSRRLTEVVNIVYKISKDEDILADADEVGQRVRAKT